MSNVALAAAVTSYARIAMIPYKLNPNTLYTDTDSAFMSVALDSNLIGNGLKMLLREILLIKIYFSHLKQLITKEILSILILMVRKYSLILNQLTMMK